MLQTASCYYGSHFRKVSVKGHTRESWWDEGRQEQVAQRMHLDCSLIKNLQSVVSLYCCQSYASLNSVCATSVTYKQLPVKFNYSSSNCMFSADICIYFRSKHLLIGAPTNTIVVSYSNPQSTANRKEIFLYSYLSQFYLKSECFLQGMNTL